LAERNGNEIEKLDESKTTDYWLLQKLNWSPVAVGIGAGVTEMEWILPRLMWL
jgi:hypothetical protein